MLYVTPEAGFEYLMLNTGEFQINFWPPSKLIIVLNILIALSSRNLATSSLPFSIIESFWSDVKGDFLEYVGFAMIFIPF